jgi:hypothetical protein
VDSHPHEPGHDAHGGSYAVPPPRGILASLRPLPTPTDEDLARLTRIGQLVDELAGTEDSYEGAPLFETMRPRYP